MYASKLGLAALTGCYFLSRAKAQAFPALTVTVENDGPVIFNTTVTVSWEDNPKIYIGGLVLVQLNESTQPPLIVETIQTIIAVPTCSLPSFPLVCQTTLSSLPASSAIFKVLPDGGITETAGKYRFELFWATQSTVADSTLLSTAFSPEISIDLNASTRIPSIAATLTRPTTSTLSPGQNTVLLSPTSNTNAATGTLPQSSGGFIPQSTNPTENTPVSNSNAGLSTVAKVGIAVGVVGFALLVLIVALLFWQRNRKRKLKSLPIGSAQYANDVDSTNRDLTAEKEMNVSNSPIGVVGTNEIRRSGTYTGFNSSETHQMAPTETREQMHIWTPDDHRGSHGSAFGDGQAQTQVHGSLPTTAAAPVMVPTAVVARKPVGGPSHHLREPGMSNEEVARLEEEERRIDEAIAEAERREGFGSR